MFDSSVGLLQETKLKHEWEGNQIEITINRIKEITSPPLRLVKDFLHVFG